MKRTYLLAATTLAFAIAAAIAGPEPISAKESKAVIQPVEKECSWTGFYLGAHGGYSFGDDLTFRENHQTDPAYEWDQDGFFYGGQIGVNLQIGRWFVTGLEASLSGIDLSDNNDLAPGNEESRGHFSSDWLATVGVRGGISLWRNHILVYATGGPAFTRFHYDTRELNVKSPEKFSAEEGRAGGFAGGGLEYALNCHWSLRLEYDHFIFDADDVIGFENQGSRHEKRSFRSDVGDRNAFSAGINFKF